MRRRKVVYPPPKTATKGGPAPEARATPPSRVVAIDPTAMRGRSGIVAGMRVEIATGLYAGEGAVVESLVGGVIPAALVRTDAGRTRRVRAVDLRPPAGPSGDAPADPG